MFYSTVLGVNGWAGSAWWGRTFHELFIKSSWKVQQNFMNLWDSHKNFKTLWSFHDLLMKTTWKFQVHEKFFPLKFLSTRSWSVSEASRTFEKIPNLSKCLPLVVSFGLCARNSPLHWPQTCLEFNLNLFLGCNDLPSSAKMVLETVLNAVLKIVLKADLKAVLRTALKTALRTILRTVFKTVFETVLETVNVVTKFEYTESRMKQR